MKYGIYTDLHCSNTSSIMPLHGERNYTARLDMIVKTGKWMYDIFEENKVDIILNGGDIFDSNNVSASELTAISEFYSYSRGIKEITIVGNHDKLNDNFNASSVLNNYPFIEVYNKPQKIGKVSVLPHMNPSDITPDVIRDISNDILLSHIDIKGSHLRPDFIMDSGVDPSLISMFFKKCFNGHLHTYEKIDDVTMNIGSCTSNSFSDSNNYIPSILVYDSDNGEIKRFNNLWAPLFRKISINSISDLMNYLGKLDYSKYILRITSPFKIKDDVKTILSKDNRILSFRIVSDISESTSVINNELSSITNDFSSNSNLIKDKFLSFISNNKDLLKYPENVYVSIMKGLK